MKKLAILVMLTLVIAAPAYAQLSDTDNSTFSIQNLGGADATIDVTFYEEDGTSWHPDPVLVGVSNPFTLGPGAKQDIYMPAVPTLPDGRYSVVIESTEPVAVVANLLGENTTHTTYYNGSYSGMDAGAGTIYFPSTQYEFYNWNSLMSVQNTTPDPITADLYIYDGAGVQAAHQQQTLPAFSSYHWDLETGGAGLGLTAGLNGSAKVVCSGNCVGTDNQTAAGGYTQSYNAFIGGAQTLYAPSLYTDFYTWGASLKVQNIGAGDTTVGVTYVVEGGATCTPPNQTVHPNQALTHYLPTDWATWGCDVSAPATNKIIGAVVTSSAEDVVAVVNAANPAKQAQTYNAFDAGTGTVGLPVVMNQFYGWDTSVVCQNLDNTLAATVTYSYSGGVGCPAGPVYPGCTLTLNPQEAKPIYQPADLDGTTGGYGMTVTATGAPVACIVNETHPGNQAAGTGDWSMSYNGFGQ